MRQTSFAMIALLTLTGTVQAATLAEAEQASGVPGGLLVEWGCRDTALLEAAAKTGQWVAVGLPAQANEAPALRAKLASAGVLGESAILETPSRAEIPLANNTVALLVLDTTSRNAPPKEEVQRVLRPSGAAYVGANGTWQIQRKERPKGLDDWRQYFYDGGANDVSKDSIVGPARGVQWSAGGGRIHTAGVRTSGEVLVMPEVRPGGGKTTRVDLVGRDAFSGVRLWTAAVSPASRFCFLVDDERVYVHPDQSKPMIALDLHTGRQVLSFDQGFQCDTKEYRGRLLDEAWPQARLTGGVLVQTWRGNLWALEAKTGKLLWKQACGDGLKAFWPATGRGLVVVVEGGRFGTANSYIEGFTRGELQRVVARDLKTGQERWRWTWRDAQPAEVSHLCIADGMVGLSLLKIRGKEGGSSKIAGQGLLLNLDLATGKERYLADAQTDKGLNGHGYFRTFIRDRKQWRVIMSSPTAFDASTGKPTGTTIWARNWRCHPARSTANLLFSSLSAASLTDNRYQWNEAARSSCDLGTFPAEGLLYQTATNCGCFAWLPSNNAFHSAEPPREAAAMERLEKGHGRPAPTAAGTWPVPTDWPMHLRDAARSAWSDAHLGAEPKQAWAVKLGEVSPKNGVGAEWDASTFHSGAISATSVAEGTGVVSLVDRQQVLGFDPKTGKVLWRTAVDGRVDSAPTIYRGVVLCGTRTGWVYALARDTGELVWRFYAPPVARNIVDHGQIESAWPLFGTVTVVNGTAWVAAGREVETDGGFWWWGLDPLTGAVKGRAHTGFDGAWQDPKDNPRKDPSGGAQGRFGCAATPLVSDGRNLFLQRFGLDAASGTRIAGAPTEGSSFNLQAPRIIVPGQFGFLNTGDLSTGRHGPMALYASVPAKFHAVRDPDFVSLWSGGPHTGGRENGGAPTLRRWKRREDKGGTATSSPAWVDSVWSVSLGQARMDDAQGLAVIGNTVAAAVGTNLALYDLADGKVKATVKLPAPAVFGGVSAAADALFVSCADGSLVSVK